MSLITLKIKEDIMDKTKKSYDYLYHYTSLETLALILKNKTMRFNSLENVDDKLEGETEDIGKFGKYLYVNCWTHLEEESIELWSLYTNNMTGVRIKIKANPFKQFFYKKGEHRLSDDTNAFIDLEKLNKENKASYVSSNESYFDVIYTDDSSLIYPKCFDTSTGTLESKNLGVFKKKIWGFQQEVRYGFLLLPFSEEEYNNFLKDKSRANPLNKLSDAKALKAYDYYDVELQDDAFENIEVIMGPRMSKGDKILLEALLERYCCGKYKLLESELPIK